jgi:hypothetical protein
MRSVTTLCSIGVLTFCSVDEWGGKRRCSLAVLVLWRSGQQPEAIRQHGIERGNEFAVVDNPNQRVDGVSFVRVFGFKMGGKRPLRIPDRLILCPQWAGTNRLHVWMARSSMSLGTFSFSMTSKYSF